MSYGIKYRIIYCDKNNVEAKVEIEVRGYSGAVQNVEGTPDVFSLRYDLGGKQNNIISSFADINLFENPITIDDLKTLNETDIRVSFYIANVLKWQGFALPDFFETDIKNNAVISISATDRLSVLKDKTIGGFEVNVTPIRLISEVLNQTGLALNINSIINFSASGVTDVMRHLTLDGQRLTDDRGRNISAYDILSSLLALFNSYIVQRNNEWYIINKWQLENGGGTLYKYNASGAYQSSSTFTPTQVSFDEISAGGRRKIEAGALEVSLFGEYGGMPIYPNNYDFRLWGLSGFDGWSAKNGFVAMMNQNEVIGYSGNSAIIGSGSVKRRLKFTLIRSEHILNPYLPSHLESDEWLSLSGSEAEIKISINATSKNNTVFGVGIIVKDADGNLWTQNESSIWKKRDSNHTGGIYMRIAFDDETSGANDVVSISANIGASIRASDLGEYILSLSGASAKMVIFGVGKNDADVFISSAKIAISQSGDQPQGTLFKVQQQNDFSKKFDTQTIIFSDYVRSGINGHFYPYRSDDTSIIRPIAKFSANGETDYLALLSARQASRLFSSARDVLTITIDASNIDPLAVYVCGSKKYIATESVFDFFRSKLDLRLEENVVNNTAKKDFVYSYFGEGEPGIKSIGGISGGSGGGSGGGMTADQAAILSEVQDLAHEHGNKGVLDQVTQEVVDKALREILTTESEEEATDENLMSALRVLREITESSIGLDDKYLSKKDDDTAAGHITLNDGFTSKSHSYIEAPLDVDKKLTAKGGIKFGENYAPGLTGVGGLITEDARAFLRSLSLTEFLEAPEYRFNRIDVIAGDLWNTKGAGIIEEVDTVNQIITLKLEKGDIGRFRYDDIVMGIFHSFNDADNSVDSYDDGIGNRRYSGFATSYFRVTQILDAEYYSKFRYELRPTSPRYPKQFHPQPFMTSAAYGNFTNAERQTSMYQTTSYIRLLRNVNDWEFGIENIGMQWGDLNNLSIFGLDMTGYSAYMENVYFSGIIHQLSAKIKEQLDAQRVGGKNLLREYDIRFGFKYWGNAGEYTEFDMNLIESTPQLQVQPNTLNWTFPIRYGTIVITANGVWNITTPNWVNAFPAVGSGNKNVDLKAGEYKGRNARVGTVAVQSGVIQRNVSISQAGLTEFVTIDPILNIGYEAQTVTITGKSNSRKLTFTTDTGYLEINLPAQYKVNGTNVNNGSLIAGDPGALDEYNFSITVAVGENVEEFSIQNNIFATAEGGQKAISTIVQRRTRIKVLADADNSVISIGDMIFHIN